MKKDFLNHFLCIVLIICMVLSLSLSTRANYDQVISSVANTSDSSNAAKKQSCSFSNDDIAKIIEEFLSSDGAEAEIKAESMVECFFADTISFLSAVETLPLDSQDTVLQYIASYVAYGSVQEKNCFETAVNIQVPEFSNMLENLKLYYNEVLLEAGSTFEPLRVNAPLYDIETVRKNIDSYLSSDSSENEEFFNYLYEAYQAEPKQIGSIIVEHSKDDLHELICGLASVYEKNGISVDRTVTNDMLSEQIFNALQSCEYDEMTFQQDRISSTSFVPTIASFSYSGKIEVGKPTPFSIKLTESKGKGSSRTYTVKVFCTRNGTEWQVATTNIIIPAGETAMTKVINISFSHAGTFTTRVAVYSGTRQLASRTGARPDISYGKWKIVVTFQKDRTKYGTFALYNAAGEQQVSGSALGRGQNNLPENKPFGNTPCGEYTGLLAGPHHNTTSFGPNKYIETHAVNVPAIQQYGRDDAMWIHGGRSQETLQWTEGCVRVFDSSMLSMQNSITIMTSSSNGHEATGIVIYREN